MTAHSWHGTNLHLLALSRQFLHGPAPLSLRECAARLPKLEAKHSVPKNLASRLFLLTLHGVTCHKD